MLDNLPSLEQPSPFPAVESVTLPSNPTIGLAQQHVDAVQFALGLLPAVECPVTNRFTPGLYSREIFMPKGTGIVSRVHKTEHQFAVLAGRARVWTEDAGVRELCAGMVGITKPGTRRVLYIVEDCRWITFHPTTTTDLDALQDELTTTPDVSYVGELTAADSPAAGELTTVLRDLMERADELIERGAL